MALAQSWEQESSPSTGQCGSHPPVILAPEYSCPCVVPPHRESQLVLGANRMWQKRLHVAFEARSRMVLQISPCSPWSLGRSPRHVARTLQQPQGGVHRERSWGSQLPAGTNLVQCMSHSESESSQQIIYINYVLLFVYELYLNRAEYERENPLAPAKLANDCSPS